MVSSYACVLTYRCPRHGGIVRMLTLRPCANAEIDSNYRLMSVEMKRSKIQAREGSLWLRFHEEFHPTDSLNAWSELRDNFTVIVFGKQHA